MVVVTTSCYKRPDDELGPYQAEWRRFIAVPHSPAMEKDTFDLAAWWLSNAAELKLFAPRALAWLAAPVTSSVLRRICTIARYVLSAIIMQGVKLHRKRFNGGRPIFRCHSCANILGTTP